MWGPYGETWGLIDLDYNFDLVESLGIVHLKANFFYPNENGEKVIFPITNAHKLWYMTNGNNGYKKIDEDFAKKLETNTVTKSLAKLGFSADIFMGKFEDQDYINEQKIIHDLEVVKMSDDKLAEEKQKFFEWAETQIKAYALIPNAAGVKAAYTQHMKKVRSSCVLLKIPFEDTPEGKEGMATKFTNAQRAQIAKIEEKSQEQVKQNQNKPNQ